MPKPKAQAPENLLLSEVAKLKITQIWLLAVQPQIVRLYTDTDIILANILNSNTGFMEMHNDRR